ncbi:MAG: MBL fold metallo-hydrolase [Xanthomonadaceae bacterium]|nr:MBL fold metallo-hydrolase [Xanthomonadaceae bacterium]
MKLNRISANVLTMNRLTILGSGTSTGVPIMLCSCKVCKSKDPKNKRLRASIFVETQGKSFLIDTSTDLRQQTLRFKIKKVDAVLYTHPHADHISGIDELRAFNFMQKSRMPAYVHSWTAAELPIRYPYIFKPEKIVGGGIPLIDLKMLNEADPYWDVLGVRVIPVSVQHGSKIVVGYRFGTMAYITDCNFIPETSLDRLKNLDVLVLDCVKIGSHDTHFNLEKALDVVSKLKPKKTYLTHLGHDFDFKTWQKKLPKNVGLAYDGLQLKWR